MIRHRIQDNSLAAFSPIFARAVTEAANIAAPRIHVDDIEIVFAEGRDILPELGFCGYLRGPRRIDVVAAGGAIAERGDLAPNLARVLAHEMHHCMRMRSVGYGRRLGEVIVSEGLACQFEREALGGTVPVYASPVRGRQDRH